MKAVVLIVLGVALYFASGISAVWAIVEFILYLAKDKEFNWWSIWLIPICFLIGVICLITGSTKYKWKETRRNKHSAFDARIAEMEAKRRAKQ